MSKELFDYTEIKSIIIQLAQIIRYYKKTDELINPQNIRNEFAKLFGYDEIEREPILNLKLYFEELGDLIKEFIEKNVDFHYKTFSTL